MNSVRNESIANHSTDNCQTIRVVQEEMAIFSRQVYDIEMQRWRKKLWDGGDSNTAPGDCKDGWNQ